MADVQPLKTLRYDPDVAGPLEDLIAPPYDVIDDERGRSWRRGARTTSSSSTSPRATRAPRRPSDEWRESGVLVQEDEPAIWVLRQDYTAPDGSTRTRTGFFARVRVEDYGRGPHPARTSAPIPGPKEDRLRLTRATRANLSPIFSLFPDAGGAATETLAQATGGEPFARGHGPRGHAQHALAGGRRRADRRPPGRARPTPSS